MNLSTLFNYFIIEKNTSNNEIESKTGVSVSTLVRYKRGEGFEKFAAVFDYLTTDVTNTEFINAIEKVKKEKIMYEEFLNEKLKKGELTENQHQFICDYSENKTI